MRNLHLYIEGVLADGLLRFLADIIQGDIDTPVLV
jgi:hypothetical protein